MVEDPGSFAVVELHKPGRVWFRLTRKGLVANVLNSSLDLSSYKLFVRKSNLCLMLIQGAVGTWIGYHVDGQFIRRS